MMNSTLFLTGATGALASSIRDHFLNEGWNVAGFDIRDNGFTHENYKAYRVDGSVEAQVQGAFDKAMTEIGTPEALIATVGGVKPWTNIDEMKYEDFEFIIRLNLSTTFLAVKHAMRLMRIAGSGAIITIGAEPGLKPEAKKSAYVAAKAAVIALTRAVAEEGKSAGITANSIVPTTIHTKANEEWGTDDEIPKWTAPEDIAATCFFLASKPGRAINGATIRIPNRM
ncbi:MAG: SDR family oxidoreductase [Candidatus Kapaibacterium sp.]|jgi:NAD(P)-dependent dehydrogenase (short-subunit alcohol dehydrogenase family)